MRRPAQLLVALLLLTGSVAAQQRPIFDPDDWVDPRRHSDPIFISRLALGAMRSAEDDYRPLRQDAGFLHLANSFYWSRFQLDYKRSEVRGENANGPAQVRVCPCVPPIYFPPSPNPRPGSKDSLQFAWYHTQHGAPGEPPVMLRSRITITSQKVETVTTFLDTGHFAGRLHGHERSVGLDTDTYFRIGGHEFFGSLFAARTTRSETTNDGSQNELTYVFRPAGLVIRTIVFRGTLAVGGVTGRGTSGVNIINPAFEAFFHEPATSANFHLIWSPLAIRNRNGWQTHHQMLLSMDRALLVKLLARRSFADR